jgi:DNA-binding NarL/FixJ family response regulator
MPGRIRVQVLAADPVSEAGVASQLRFRSELDVVPANGTDQQPAVVIVVADEVDEERLRTVRAVRRSGRSRVVLVASELDGRSVLAAVESGASGIVRRREATPDRLSAAIRAAANGDGTLPPDLLGRLLQQFGDPRHSRGGMVRGLTFGGLTQRELSVLQLLADGFSTSEIARELAYSERTIKNAIHDLTSRLNLRNRSHAVAFALRQGLI